MTNDMILPKYDLSLSGDPEVQISCVSNMYVRMMHFKRAGDIEHGHSHPFDHMTLLAEGRLRVTVDGDTRDFDAPKILFITKDKEHELVALQDHTVAFCVHPIRDGSRVEDIIDPEGIVIPPGAEGIETMRAYYPHLLDSLVHTNIKR
jgi:quercetin dioxygenase-like cupin family protein